MLERAATITRGRDGDLATRQTQPAAVTRHYALASTSRRTSSLVAAVSIDLHRLGPTTELEP